MAEGAGPKLRPFTAAKSAPPGSCTTAAWYTRDVDTLATLDEIVRLLDAGDAPTVNTSMRLPASLRDAAALAVDVLGVAPSTTALAADALRRTLNTIVMEAALRHHYDQHPDARPSLAEVALALAAQDGSPLADRPEVVVAAAEEITRRHPDAGPDDVLLWAEAQLAAAS